MGALSADRQRALPGTRSGRCCPASSTCRSGTLPRSPRSLPRHGRTAAWSSSPCRARAAWCCRRRATCATSAAVRRHGAMLVVDEMQTGMGRLGTWWGADRRRRDARRDAGRQGPLRRRRAGGRDGRHAGGVRAVQPRPVPAQLDLRRLAARHGRRDRRGDGDPRTRGWSSGPATSASGCWTTWARCCPAVRGLVREVRGRRPAHRDRAPRRGAGRRSGPRAARARGAGEPLAERPPRRPAHATRRADRRRRRPAARGARRGGLGARGEAHPRPAEAV